MLPISISRARSALLAVCMLTAAVKSSALAHTPAVPEDEERAEVGIAAGEHWTLHETREHSTEISFSDIATPARAFEPFPSTRDGLESGHRTDLPGRFLPEPFGFDLATGWLDPWPHSHFSRRGTPFVHLFATEPAYLDRDLFIDGRWVDSEGEEEFELETELEWALTRRIGVVIEAPVARLVPDDGPTETGIGDIAISPRALLVDTDRFLMSGNFEIAIPSGNEDRGLGSGEIALAPSMSTWLDLGNWVAVQTQVGAEFGMDSGDSELFYNAGLTWSFLTRAEAHSSAAGAHFPPGMVSLISEVTGRIVLENKGGDEGRSTAEILFGVSYNFAPDMEIRGGYQVPIGGPQDINQSVTIGLIIHF